MLKLEVKFNLIFVPCAYTLQLMAEKGEMPYCCYQLSLLQTLLKVPVEGAAVPYSVCTAIVTAEALSSFPVLPWKIS